MKYKSENIKAVLGLLSIVPFLVLNAVVGSRVQPFFSLLRPDIDTSTLEYMLLAGSLLLLPLGGVFTFSPMLKNRTKGSMVAYPLHCVIALCLLGIFVLLAFGFGSEIYRCDVLNILNCD